MRSYRGIGGGYELALPPDRINLLMVVRCTGGERLFEVCILEDRDCSPQHHCPLHESWINMRDQLKRVMEGNTLAELVRARQSGSIKAADEARIFTGLPDHEGGL